MTVSQIRGYGARGDAGTHVSLRSEGEVWQNRLLNLLAATTDQQPFAQNDWPNPRGYPRLVNLLTHLSPKTLDPPLLPTDWPNPRPKPVINFTWTQSSFSRPDTFFGLAGHPNFDWPNPRAPAFPVSLRTHIDPLKVLTFVEPATPKISIDWPNPRGPVHAWTIEPTGISFLGFDTFYGEPGQAPTYVLPNPRGPLHPISLRTWIDPTKLNLIGKDTFFGAPGQTKVYDWPNPRGAVFSIGLRTHVDPLKVLTYVTPPQVPTYVLPNPRGPEYPVSLRSHLVPLNLLAGKDTFFGLAGHPNFNWPNPTLPGIFRQEGTLGENRPLYGGGVAPSAGADEWIIRARRRGRR